jgi:inner membrane protein
MTLGSHLLASWLLAHACKLPQRERRLVAVAGVLPDLDGFGWVLDRINTMNGGTSDLYFQYHHILGHNLLATLAIACIVLFAAQAQKWLAASLALGVAHLHLFCDMLGSRGPDGYQWPIAYLRPFSDGWQWVWSGQWELHAWQNSAITLAMLGIAMVCGWQKNYSFVEVISAKLDRAFFDMLNRYGLTRQARKKSGFRH